MGVSSVAYYISIIIDVTLAGVRILLTPCSHIRISIDFHSVVGMVVYHTHDDKESKNEQVKLSHWVC